MAGGSGPISFSSTPPIGQQCRVGALVSVQKAAQQIASILELDELLDTVVQRTRFIAALLAAGFFTRERPFTR